MSLGQGLLEIVTGVEQLKTIPGQTIPTYTPDPSKIKEVWAYGTEWDFSYYWTAYSEDGLNVRIIRNDGANAWDYKLETRAKKLAFVLDTSDAAAIGYIDAYDNLRVHHYDALYDKYVDDMVAENVSSVAGIFTDESNLLYTVGNSVYILLQKDLFLKPIRLYSDSKDIIISKIGYDKEDRLAVILAEFNGRYMDWDKDDDLEMEWDSENDFGRAAYISGLYPWFQTDRLTSEFNASSAKLDQYSPPEFDEDKLIVSHDVSKFIFNIRTAIAKFEPPAVKAEASSRTHTVSKLVFNPREAKVSFNSDVTAALPEKTSRTHGVTKFVFNAPVVRVDVSHDSDTATRTHSVTKFVFRVT